MVFIGSPTDNTMAKFWSLGHSTQPYKRFSELLRSFGITAIADVRSSPYSGRFPHFNREDLKAALKSDNIAYAFMGKELGGRPTDPSLLTNGVADYERMAEAAPYIQGLNRIIKGSDEHRIALVCSEAHPLDCHRCLLVGRSLMECGHDIEHILTDGETHSQKSIESMLIDRTGLGHRDFFINNDDIVRIAYKERAMRVAYSIIDKKPVEKVNHMGQF